MIGPLEIVILLVIVLLVTGAYKKLPQLGRSAGTNARIGSEKARELADRNAPRAKELAEQAGAKGSEVGAKVGEKVDAGSLGRRAGKGLREAREMRDSFKGTLDPPKRPEGKPAPEPVSEPAAELEPEAAPESGAPPEISPEAEPAVTERSDDETPA